MSDEDIASSPEHARSTKDRVAPAKDPIIDAFSLLSKHLDNERIGTTEEGNFQYFGDQNSCNEQF